MKTSVAIHRTTASRFRSTPLAPRSSPSPLATPGRVREVLHGPHLQPKLTVGPPDDAYEHEADRVADEVMRMPEPEGRVQRVCAECEEEVQRQPVPGEDEEEKKLQRKAAPGQIPEVNPDLESRIAALRGGGQPLPFSERAFFEPRFGRDFGDVRIHSGPEAADLAQRVQARAFTLGDSIVFGTGQYAPGASAGRQLLAHELTHVVQQDKAAIHTQSDVEIRRTAATCPSGWRSTVSADDTRAKNMIDVARTKLSSYNGTTPPEVKTALDRHFKASSTGFASWINFNLSFLRTAAALASYDCEDTSSWWCGASTLAKTFWCVPFVDIRVCQPLYFSQSDQERSATLIHEWVHKYGCNFDLGYSHEADYPSQWTLTALINADPWSEFVKDVQ